MKKDKTIKVGKYFMKDCNFDINVKVEKIVCKECGSEDLKTTPTTAMECNQCGNRQLSSFVNYSQYITD